MINFVIEHVDHLASLVIVSQGAGTIGIIVIHRVVVIHRRTIGGFRNHLKNTLKSILAEIEREETR